MQGVYCLIFNTFKQKKQRVDLSNGHAELHVKPGSAIEKQIKMIALTKEDLKHHKYSSAICNGKY